MTGLFRDQRHVDRIRGALIAAGFETTRITVAAPDAPLTLVQYGDYECPYTRRSLRIVAALQQRLGARLRFVYRNFPLTEVHPHAAEAAEAADAQGRFWPMHDELFAHQHELEDSQLVDHARAVGLDVEQFAREMAAHAHLDRIQAGMQGGLASGVQGTPTFVVSCKYRGIITRKGGTCPWL